MYYGWYSFVIYFNVFEGSKVLWHPRISSFLWKFTVPFVGMQSPILLSKNFSVFYILLPNVNVNFLILKFPSISSYLILSKKSKINSLIVNVGVSDTFFYVYQYQHKN